MQSVQFFDNNAILNFSSQKIEIPHAQYPKWFPSDSSLYCQAKNLPIYDEKTIQELLKSIPQQDEWKELMVRVPRSESHNSDQRATTAIKSLKILLNLPRRLWNQEWQEARANLILAERSQSLPSCIKRDGLKKKKKKERLPVFCSVSYKAMIDLQLDFLYVCCAVMDAMVTPRGRTALAKVLALYYTKHMTNRKNSSSLESYRTSITCSAVCPKIKSSLIKSFKNISIESTGTNVGRSHNSRSSSSSSSRSSSSIRSSSSRPDSCLTSQDFFFKEAYKLYTNVLRFYEQQGTTNITEDEPGNQEFENETDCLDLFDWCSKGFEFQGVWFRLVHDVTQWKTAKREVALARCLLMNSAYPCPPLIYIAEAFQFSLIATALLVTEQTGIVTPPQFPPNLIPRAISRICCAYARNNIKTSLKSKNLKYFVRGLDNSSQLLTLYAPCLFPLYIIPDNHSRSIHLTLAFMCLSDMVTPQKLSNTSFAMRLRHSFQVVDELINKKSIRVTDLLKTGLRHYMKPYLPYNMLSLKNLSSDNSCGVKTLNSTPVNGPVIALGFLESSFAPHIKTLESGYDLQSLREFCSSLFDCEADYILPYDPLCEGNLVLESKDSIWNITFFGYPCSVFYSTKKKAELFYFHSLSARTSSHLLPRGSITRPFLRLPWENENFVILPGPSPINFRPEAYVTSKRYDPKCNLEKCLKEIVERVTLCSIESITSLHQIIHYFGLPVSLTLWHMWMLFRNKHICSSFVVELIACHLVTSAMWRLAQYYTTYSRDISDSSIKFRLLYCFGHCFLRQDNREKHSFHNQDMKTVMTFVHLLLWLSFLKTCQISRFEFTNDLILDLCHTAQRNPDLLYKCLNSRTRLSLSNLLHSSYKDAKQFRRQCNFKRLTSRMSETLDELHQDSGILIASPSQSQNVKMDSYSRRGSLCSSCIFDDLVSRWNPKIGLTMEPCCIVVQSLIFQSVEDVWDQKLLTFVHKTFCQSPYFSRCETLLGWSLTTNQSSNFNVSYQAVFKLAKDMIVKTRESDYSIRFEFIRTALLFLLHYLFQSMTKALMGVSCSEVPSCQEIEDVVGDIKTMEKFYVNYSYLMASVHLIQGVSILLRGDYDDTVIMMHFSQMMNYLNGSLLESNYQMPKKNCIFFLYPCWILAYYFRYRDLSIKASYYESLFRYLRSRIACSPLPYCFPYVGCDQSKSLKKNILWDQHRTFLHPSCIQCILASNFLNFTQREDIDHEKDINNEWKKSNLLSFGNNSFGCLGLGYPTTRERLDEMNRTSEPLWNGDVWWTPEPTCVSVPSHYSISDISCGKKHCLALTDSGVVISWGDNQEGQLGRSCHCFDQHLDLTKRKCYNGECLSHYTSYGMNYDFQSQKIRIKECCFLEQELDIIDLYFQESHLGMSSTEDHSVKTSKASFEKGDESEASDSNNEDMNARDVLDEKTFSRSNKRQRFCPQLCRIVTLPTSVKFISCGLDFSAAITDDDRLFMWGSNAFGQLGLGDCFSRFTPTHVETLTDPLSFVSCGYSHTGAITSNNMLFLWGSNSRGQLGFPLLNPGTDTFSGSMELFSTTPRRLIVMECGFFGEDLPMAFDSTPLKMCYDSYDTINLLWRRDFYSNTYLVSVNNSGIENGNELLKETVTFLTVSCGYSHTLAVDFSNRAWSWGSCDYGELGLEILNKRDDSDENETFHLLLDSWIRLYEKEQNLRASPCRLPAEFFSNQRILEMVAGKYTSSALDSDHHVWFWGRNLYNNLSISREEGSFSEKPLEAIVFKDYLIDKVCYGWDGTHQVVTTQDGRFALWGKHKEALCYKMYKWNLVWKAPENDYDELCEHDKSHSFIPESQTSQGDPMSSETLHSTEKVTLPCLDDDLYIKKIVLGSDHCLFLTLTDN